MQFLNDLAANATKHNVAIAIYSGNDYALEAHRGSESMPNSIHLTIRLLTWTSPCSYHSSEFEGRVNLTS